MTGGVGVSCPLLEGKVLGSNPVLDTLDNGEVGWLSSFLFQLSLLSVLALSTNILLRSCSACIVVLFIPCFFLARALYSSLAALTTLSAWLMVGFVRYLCLKNTVSEILSELVDFA